MRNPSKVQTDSAGDETAESATASLFTTSAIEKLLEQVAHAAQFTGGIQVVEGPHASGKSTLAKQLCDKHLSHAALLGFIHISAGLDVHSVLLASAQALGLPAKEAHLPGELMASLRSLAQSLQVQSQVSVLVIDDAHRLDQQALGALVSLLQGGGESVFGLHLVLWSEPGLVERLDALHLVDIPVHDFAVPLLTINEAESFLRQSQQGVQNSEQKQRAHGGADLQEIWRDSGGCIGLLQAAKEDFEARHLSVSKPGLARFKDLPLGHAAALALLLLVLLVGVLVRGPDVEPTDTASESTIASDRIAEKLSPPISSQASSSQTGSPSTIPAPEAPVSEATLPETSLPATPLSETPTLETSAPKTLAPELPDTLSAETALPEIDSPESNKADDKVPAPVVSESRLAINDEQVIVEAELQPKLTRNQPQPQSESEPEPEPGPSQDVTMNAPNVAMEADPPTMRRESSAQNNSQSVLGDVQKLLALDGDSYSLQVMSATSLDSLQQFKSEQANRTGLYIYRAQRQGRTWYILLAGNYSTRSAASQAIPLLPKAQRKGGPWPRKLSDIHREIAEDRGH